MLHFVIDDKKQATVTPYRGNGGQKNVAFGGNPC